MSRMVAFDSDNGLNGNFNGVTNGDRATYRAQSSQWGKVVVGKDSQK